MAIALHRRCRTAGSELSCSLAKGRWDTFYGVRSGAQTPALHELPFPGRLPRQGDDGHPHAMDVRRGPEGHGVTGEKCSTCHQDHNLAGTHLPPGAPNWGLPPASTPMIWQGLSDAQICKSIKDPKQNKNRNLDQLVEHLTEDKLVMWAWTPGEGRTPVPMPHDEFAAKVKQWQAAGAPCP
jgi:hypothetical protein